jgi:hypothetical protein
MKTKRNLIIAVCLCLSSYCWAERTTFQERTDNWLKSSSESGRPEIPDDDDDGMASEPKIRGTAVGDAVWLLVGMGAVYAFYRCKPQRKALRNEK